MAGLIDVGILKPELGNALAAGYKQAEERRNLLAQQQQQRQLGELQLQNALREQRMAGEEEAAYKTAGSDYAKLQAELMQRGLGKQAMAIGAQQAKMQADKIAMLKGTTELMKSAASSVMENPTLENALAAVKDLGQRTGTDVSRDVDALTKTGGNPEAIYKWAAGHAVSADKRLNEFKQFSVPGVGVQTGTTDFTGKFTPGQVFQEQMSQAQMAQDERDRQRLGLERQRLAQEATGVVYQEDANGNVIALPSKLKKGEVPMARVAVAPGGGFQPLQGKPSEAVGKEIMSLNQQKAIVNGALSAVKNTPTAFGLDRGMMGETIGGKFYDTPAEAEARAYVYNVVSGVIKERAGTAQSASEKETLNRFLPGENDNAKQLEAKFTAFNKYLADKESGTTKKRSGTVQSASNIDDLLNKYK